MSTSVAHLADPTLFQQPFVWNQQRSQAAIQLASGASKQEAADAVNVHRSTIYEWLLHPDFCAEVDRLSLMVGIASRAERLRLAMSVIRSRIKEEVLQSDRDALDWLKFAQSETDGVKIDLTKLAAIAETETPVADSRQGRLPSATEENETDRPPAVPE